MSFLTILAADGKPIDDARSIDEIFPAQAEVIYGTIASAMSDRTERIQNELDESAAAKAEAEAEAADIRQAAGDIDAERQRLFADADEQAEVLLAEGRARLDQEVADLEARADADIASAAGRATDELRGEISRLASSATDEVLAGGVIDDAMQQDLIEQFIQKVGAS